MWLVVGKAVSNGNDIIIEFISPNYDLKLLKGVVAFLHSNIQMHCLLKKKNAEEIDGCQICDSKTWVHGKCHASLISKVTQHR